MSKKIAGPEIERLVALLARLPGLGPRSARKAALGLLKKRHELLVPLADAMRTAVEKIIECPQCGNLDTVSPCTICQDPRRDRSIGQRLHMRAGQREQILGIELGGRGGRGGARGIQGGFGVLRKAPRTGGTLGCS